MIYLDNAATSRFKPRRMFDEMFNQLACSSNPGRGGHNDAIDTAIKIYDVRELLKTLVGGDDNYEVIFTSGCTEAANLAILGYLAAYKGQRAEVIFTSYEHNSVARPLWHLKETSDVKLIEIKPDKDGRISSVDINNAINENTRLVCVNHMSNVDGEIADIEKIGNFCKENDIIFLVDCAQSAGHIKIDMDKMGIDLLALAPHKALYSPQGVGVLAYNEKTKINPIRFGGTGTESENVYQPLGSVETYESGTLPTPSILGLGAGIDFVKNNFIEINEKIDDLSTYLNFELSNINGVKVYTHPNNAFGVIGFNILDYGSTDVSQILSDKYEICTRGGLHCAGLKHKFLGTLNQGIVRASLSYFNSFNDCQKLVRAVKHIAKNGY